MEYRVEIQDIDNLGDVLIDTHASRDSVHLTVFGSDKREPGIRGTELSYDLEVLHGEDGKYIQYFTSDEKRFMVTNRLVSTNEIVWRGFVLPESYSEPWENPLFYVKFSAVDGVALLKGKKLEPSFYSEEKTVLDVLCACLELTKVDFDVYLAPAINNHIKKYWHEIILDTAKYYDEDKLPSAYDFLDEIVTSMQCQLFQSQGRWYIEGINKRHLANVKFYKYAITGEYLGLFNITKNIKNVKWLSPAPEITMVPAQKEIFVTHEAAKLEVTTELFQETDIKFVNATGVVGEFLPRYWNFKDYRPKVRKPDYYLELPANMYNEPLDTSKSISLKQKPFVLEGTKIRIQLAFELYNSTRKLAANTIDAIVASGKLIDMQVYKISLNDTAIFYNDQTNGNSPQQLDFNTSLQASVSLEFIASEDGYINIELFEPRGGLGPTQIDRVRLTNLSIEDIEQKENFVYSEIVDEKSSQVMDIDLAISDDISGNSKCFYPERLRAFAEGFGTYIDVPIKYGRQINGKNYSIVSVEGAVLIEQVKERTFYNYYYVYAQVNNVIFNFNGTEEMAIETEAFYGTGKFIVNILKYREPDLDRLNWIKWTDSNYNIEEKPYAQVVAEINSKLNAIPHLMVVGTTDTAIKYNDLIQFKYQGIDKFYVVVDLTWQQDEGVSRVTMIEGVYAGSSTGNLPPYINAGPDIIIDPTQTEAQITDSVANDPDGMLQSLLWERISGPTGESYSASDVLKPLISGLTGDAYTFRLTGTDNLGLSASDTMRVLRGGQYTITLEEIASESTGTGGRQASSKTYNLVVSPALLEGMNLVLTTDTYSSNFLSNGGGDYSYSAITITKNGSVLVNKVYDEDANVHDAGSIGVFAGDVITIKLEAEIDLSESPGASSSVEIAYSIKTGSVQGSAGIVLGLPIEKILAISS